MTRAGRPIEQYPLTGGVNPHIGMSQRLVEWNAAVAAGATLDELYKWEAMGEDGYPSWFKARVMVWHERQMQYHSHVEDAKAKAIKNS